MMAYEVSSLVKLSKDFQGRSSPLRP